MIVTCSAASGFIYRYAAKPVMFRFSPDTVHARMLRMGSVLQRASVVRSVVHGAWAYEDPRLTQCINGVTFRNPVGLSAGFDKNFQLVPLMRALGYGFMEGGSITYMPCAGNARPWFHRLPASKSLVVHVGLANDGADAILKRIAAYPVYDDFPLNISVAKTNSPEAVTETDAIADYVGSLRAIKSADVGDMITINISCPNTYGGEPFTSPGRLGRLLGRIDAVGLSQPIFVKLPCHLPWKELHKLLEVIERHHVAGVTISNLAKRSQKLALADPLPDSVRGGLSGKPTWQASNELIRRTRQAYGDRFTIIGVGGIFSAEDAYTKIRLGANVVELITGMIFEGPQLIGQINRGLVRLLERDGYQSIDEVVGLDVA